MKRFLAIVLAVIMCVLPVTTGVSAVTVPSTAQAVYTIGSVEGFAGDTVDVVVSFKTVEAFQAIGISQFECEALTYVGYSIPQNLKDLIANSVTAEKPIAFPPMFDPTAGKTAFTATANSNLNGYDGEIITLKYKINENAEVGVYELTAVASEKTGPNLETFVVPGKITVKGKSFYEEYPGMKMTGETSVVYDSDVHSFGITGKPDFATVSYTVDGEAFDGAEDAGTYEVTATVTADGYTPWTETKTLTIKKAPLTVSAKVSDKEYDGTDAVTALEAMPEIKGYIEGDDIKLEEETFAIRFAGTEVGTHKIDYTINVIGDDKDNYDITINVPNAKINKKKVTVKIEDKTLKVGAEMPKEEEYTYTVTPALTDSMVPLVGKITCSGNTKTANKSYDIKGTFSATSNPNYTITVTNGKLHVVNKTTQPLYVTPIEDKTYGDEPFELKYGVAEDGNSLFVSDEPWVFTAETSNISIDGTTVTILGAGEAKIIFSKKGDAELADFSETVTFTVKKKDATVTADSKTVTKGGTMPELTAQVEGAVGDDVINYTLKTTARNTNTLGDYPITVTLGTNANYNVTKTDATLSVIDKLEQGVTVTPNVPSAITYGDEGFTITYTEEKPFTDAKVTFASSDENVVKVDENGNVTIIGAGTAVITVFKAGDDKIADFEEEIKVEVAKKPITITAKNNFKKIGAPEPVLEYDYDESQLVGSDTITGNVSRVAGEEAGTYVIGPGTLDITNSHNYEVNFVPGTFTIYEKTPQGIEVTPNVPSAITYGDEGFTITYTEKDPVTDAEVKFASSDENVVKVDENGKVTIVGAGEAKITVTKAGDAELADFSDDIFVSVAKKKITVTPIAQEKYVGEDDPELTYKFDGELVGDDAFTGELVRDAGDKAGRSYEIKQGTLALNDNYELIFVKGVKLAVFAKVNQVIRIAKLEDATYGDTGLALDIEKVDYNEAAGLDFVSSNEDVATVDEDGNITITGAGTTTFTVSVNGSNKYNSFSEDVTLKVAKKTIVVYADEGLCKKVDADDPELTYTFDGELVGDDAFTGALVREEGEEVGSYEIKQGTLALNDNYILEFVGATFEILDKLIQSITFEGMPETVTYGDESFVITVKSDVIAEEDLVIVNYSSDNEDVVTIEKVEGTINQFRITVVGAGEGGFNVEIEGNEDVASITAGYGFDVAAMDVTIISIDLDNKTAEIEGLPEGVTIDFDAIAIALGDEVDEETINAVVSNIVFTGVGSHNYKVAEGTEIATVAAKDNFVTVTVVADENGEVEGAGTYYKGANITLTATPNKNYKISAWKIDGEKVSTSDTLTLEDVQQDIEVTLTFAKKSTGGGGSASPKRTVYFQINETTKKSVTVNIGDKVVAIEEPVLEGFTFGGWYMDAECTEAFDFGTAITASMTLYAKWTAVEEEPDDGEEEPVEWTNPYTDVKEGDWFYETVKAATESGIMNGMSEDTFAPNTELTRAMLVTILYRLDGEAEVDGEVTFEDADLESYYGDALVWASSNGIVTGYDEKTFAPNDKITREQIGTIIFRYAVYKGLEAVELSENLIGFEDESEISYYAISPLNWIVGKGIMNGKTATTLNPKDNATRAEAATIIARFVDFIEQ